MMLLCLVCGANVDIPDPFHEATRPENCPRREDPKAPPCDLILMLRPDLAPRGEP